MKPPSDAVRREKDEPRAGAAPLPLWMIPLAGAVLFFGAAYFFLFSGGFRWDAVNEEEGLGLRAPEETAAAAFSDPTAVLARGRTLYLRNCAVCHRPDGGGLGGQYPPLAGSEIVLGSGGYGPNHLARIVLNGLVEPVAVRGVLYNGAMVPWRDVLTDAQLAALLTYIRQAWGNQADPLPPAGIAAVRAESADRHGPWTVEQLRSLPPAPLPVPSTPHSPPAPEPAKVSP